MKNALGATALLLCLSNTPLGAADTKYFNDLSTEFIDVARLHVADWQVGKLARSAATSAAQRLADEIGQSLEAFARVGFVAKDIEIQIDLTPKVTVWLLDEGPMGDVDEEISKAGNLTKVVLQAIKLCREWSIEGYRVVGLKVDFGALQAPSVSFLTRYNFKT